MNRLGVDIGGVIIDRIHDDSDTSFFGDKYLETTAVPEAFDSLRLLGNEFGDDIWVVSKCGPRIQARTVEWLLHQSFYDQTGIPEDHVLFTRTREGKAPIARDLGLTHFVDDRLDVLGHLQHDVKHLYLFDPRPKDLQAQPRELPRARVAHTWQQARQKIYKDIQK